MRRCARPGWLALAWLCAASASAGGLAESVDPSARLPGGSAASEYWDLVAHFSAGHRVYARFQITNEGPGERNGLAFGHVIFPDGSVTPFQNGRRRDRWTLGPQGRRLEIGASVLDLSQDTRRRLSVVKQKKGIRVQLEWAADAAAVSLPESSGSGFQIDVLALAAPISGTLWVRGMDAPHEVQGRAALTHTWMNSAESKIVARRVDIVTFDPDAALFLADVTAPDGTHRQAAALAEHARITFVSHGVASDAPPPGVIPAQLRVALPELSGSVSLGEVRLRHDPLDALPLALRMVYSFGTRPHRVWADAGVAMSRSSGADRAPLSIRDTGIAALTFLGSPPSN